MITFSLILATMVKAVTIILFCAIAHSAISLHLGQEAGPQEAGPQERAVPQDYDYWLPYVNLEKFKNL